MSDVDRTALRLELWSEKDLPILRREPPEKSTFLPVRSPARQEVSAQCPRGSRWASPLPSTGHHHLNGRRFARIHRLDRMAIAAFPRVETFIVMAGAPPIDI